MENQNGGDGDAASMHSGTFRGRGMGRGWGRGRGRDFNRDFNRPPRNFASKRNFEQTQEDGFGGERNQSWGNRSFNSGRGRLQQGRGQGGRGDDSEDLPLFKKPFNRVTDQEQGVQQQQPPVDSPDSGLFKQPPPLPPSTSTPAGASDKNPQKGQPQKAHVHSFKWACMRWMQSLMYKRLKECAWSTTLLPTLVQYGSPTVWLKQHKYYPPEWFTNLGVLKQVHLLYLWFKRHEDESQDHTVGGDWGQVDPARLFASILLDVGRSTLSVGEAPTGHLAKGMVTKLLQGQQYQHDVWLYALLYAVLRLEGEGFANVLNAHPASSLFFTMTHNDTRFGAKIDAFAQNWVNRRLLLNPMFLKSLIDATIDKIALTIRGPAKTTTPGIDDDPNATSTSLLKKKKKSNKKKKSRGTLLILTLPMVEMPPAERQQLHRRLQSLNGRVLFELPKGYRFTHPQREAKCVEHGFELQKSAPFAVQMWEFRSTVFAPEHDYCPRKLAIGLKQWSEATGQPVTLGAYLARHEQTCACHSNKSSGGPTKDEKAEGEEKEAADGGQKVRKSKWEKKLEPFPRMADVMTKEEAFKVQHRWTLTNIE